MSTWNDGLLDSNAARDKLADCLRSIDLEADATHLATGLGLLVWMVPYHVQIHAEQYMDLLDRRAGWLDTLPSDAQAALRAFQGDPETFTEGGERAPELSDALGRYACGPRHDALLTLPDAGRVLLRFGNQIAAQLDEVILGELNLPALICPLVRLGPLVQLAVAGMWTPTARRVHHWRQHFDAADARTLDGRAFWDRYAQRLQKAFDILAHHARSDLNHR